MRVLSIFAVISIVMDIVTAEITNEPPIEEKVSPKLSEKELDEISAARVSKMNADTNWINKSAHTEVNEKRKPMDYVPRQSLTRLSKTLSVGFDAFFRKDQFEPFETRPKPVTLVGIRKNGLFPKKNLQMTNKSKEMAELQSPYNDVSSFWLDSPRDH